jgi:hypothetical protein
MSAIDFPLCLRIFFGKIFHLIVVVGIVAVSALSIPYGNDLHIGVGLMVQNPRNCTFAKICSKAMRNYLWSSFIPGGKKREEGSRCLCAKGSRVDSTSCC